MRKPPTPIDEIIREAEKDGQFENLPGKGKPLQIDTSPDAVIKGLLKEANISLAPEWIRLANEIDALLAENGRLLAADAARYATDRSALLESLERDPPPDQPAEPAPHRGLREALSAWLRPRPSVPPAGHPRARLVELNRRRDQALARYAARLHHLNRKLRRFNLIVPLSQRQRPLLPVAERLTEFAAQCPEAEIGPTGDLLWSLGILPTDLLTAPPDDPDTFTRPRDTLQAAALLRMHRGDRKPPPIG